MQLAKTRPKLQKSLIYQSQKNIYREKRGMILRFQALWAALWLLIDFGGTKTRQTLKNFAE